MRTPISLPHALTERRFRSFRSCFQRPNSTNLSRFPARFSASKVPGLGTKEPITATATGGRSGHFGTHLGVTGGTQTHSRRTGRKLGQLPCARQGLVRVPESNTKYGGKRRKTGGARSLQCGQVSVSPQGFPREKNCFQGADFGFAPLFTGQLFIVGEGLLRGDSREATGMSGQAFP
jgi:hypothetical protein